MRRALLPLLGVLLAACTALPTNPDPGGAALSLKAVPGQTYRAVTFAAGTQAATNLTLSLHGAGVTVNDAACRATDATTITCTFLTRPAGSVLTLYTRNAALARAAYTRPGGGSYTLVAE